MAEARSQTFADLGWQESKQLLDSLPQLPIEARTSVVERLVRSRSAEIREAALRVGSMAMSDAQITAHLRNHEDAAIRNAALEILKLRGLRGFRLCRELLGDADAQVVLQAIQALDELREPRALEPLRRLLSHPDTNVIQQTIVALGHIGDEHVIPDLLPFLDADPWLQIGALNALGELRACAAVDSIRGLLGHSLVAPAAAEALARIGNAAAFAALAEVWLDAGMDVKDPETLGTLAHVLEGLTQRPERCHAYRGRFVAALDSARSNAALDAARCLLVLGPGPQCQRALALLADSVTRSPEQAAGGCDAGWLPECLAARPDLVPSMLPAAGALRCWGLQLAARHPARIAPELICDALSATDAEVCLDCAEAALEAFRAEPAIADACFDLCARLPQLALPRLRWLLAEHASLLRPRLDDAARPTGAPFVLLADALGVESDSLRQAIEALDVDARVEALSHLSDRPEILGRLPWEEWLSQRPEIYGGIASEIAVAANLGELVPVLRRCVADAPHPAMIRALGKFADKASVPVLLEHMRCGAPLVRARVMECLGRIGGESARTALRAATLDADPIASRVAFGALSTCASQADSDLFRSVSGNADWYVRLAAVDGLARYPTEENLAVLMRLSADPAPVVARRALEALGG